MEDKVLGFQFEPMCANRTWASYSYGSTRMAGFSRGILPRQWGDGKFAGGGDFLSGGGNLRKSEFDHLNLEPFSKLKTIFWKY